MATRPIMLLLDLLGRRWTLLVLWELREEPATFRVLRERCHEMSSSVLTRRLAELIEADVIVNDRKGYQLTEAGQELLAILGPVNQWANQHPVDDGEGRRQRADHSPGESEQ